MADVKWIKIVTNIFDDEKIKYIETLPNGDETIVIWFRLLCLGGKSNSSGLLMMTDRIAYTEEMLSSIFNRDVKSIQLALNVFERLEMIERVCNKIYLTNWLKYQDLDKIEAKKEYDKEYQKNRRKLKQISYDNRTTIVEQDNENRILDIDIELDKEKDNTIGDLCKIVIEYLNKKTDRNYKLVDSSKKHIQARLKEGFTLDDFKKVIDNKVLDWNDDSQMNKFLRPETLFGTKFQSYLNSKPGHKNSNGKRVERLTNYDQPTESTMSEEEVKTLLESFENIK